MAARKLNDEMDEGFDGGADDEQGEDFYDSEVTRYVATVERDLGEAFQRYGFTLYHSLPPTKQVQLAEKLGFLVNDAVDHYNLAGVAIAEEDWAKATKLLQKALELDGTFAEAAYNLALCHEKQGKKSEAINLWSRFQELTQNEDDRKAVEAHLTELRA